MTYYFSKTISNDDLGAVEKRLRAALKDAGFGVLTEIDVKSTLKQKIDVDFRPYRILGACNPELAHLALTAEDKIGTMLPCNVILQVLDDGVEVAAVDPSESMRAVDNSALAKIAATVGQKLKGVIESL
ncbi:DUF302 domain-containing protein [Hyphococcus sp.]|uniref:DUF302 domain-containing protein n=1 Tax=Hyphococcus sp. TaxID=2038636 RepID=UPI00207FDD13|nr:MAG: hypothetical protein DHS20C04_32000 [Marinicaulis sp.]